MESTSLIYSAIWLSAFGMGILGYAGWLMRNSDYGFWESALYLPTYLMGRLLWRVHFTNSAPPELKAGAVLVANHRSSVDPFFVQLAARRRVHWMVAKEYCTHFLFGPILKAAQVIPTNRSGMDTAATKIAIRLTKSGRLVGMFPEGRLNHTREPLVSIRSGAALVAERAGVPVVPLYIAGSPYRRTVWSPVIMPGHVAITFGVPIFPKEVSAPTEKISSPLNTQPQNSNASEIEPVPDEVVPFSREVEDVSTENSLPENTLAENGTEMTSAESLILQWGRQIVTLAGHPEFVVELASKRKRITRANS